VSEPTELQLQDALGDGYRVERELGAGGMGTVYLAEDLRHGRKVAVKLLRPEIAASMGTERFHREIRIVASLQHPHILGLIDSGGTGELLYYVMPYVEGNTLRVRLARDGEPPLEEGLRILREIADALSYAHGRGVVHRDVKPENVLFSAGHAQLADFGVAKALGDRGAAGRLVTDGSVTDGSVTEHGSVIGSPGYMAPEAVSGDAAADHRADIYAFGILAYEVLAGQHPFAGTGAGQLLLAHLTRNAQPLWQVRPSVSAKLSDLVLRCLEKRPADRWQSAAEIAGGLDAMLTQLGGSTAVTPARDVTIGRFRLTEGVARRLSRSSFSPRMIGDEMEYLDNGARSDVLVCFVHAIGLDGSDFEAHLRSLPYRGIAPTLYGFEPSRRRRFAMPLDDHIVLLRELLRDVAGRCFPSTILVVGFSSGGDVALQLAVAAPAGPGPEPAVRVDGVLTLGCNLGLETCFVTRILARLEAGNGAEIVKDLRALADTVHRLDEWLDVHAYLVRMLRKFQLQVDPLREFARDIVRPFEQDDEVNPFVRWYREISGPERALRCLFEDSETCNRLVRDVQLQHLDSGALGPHYREGSLLIEPDTTHFDLVRPELVLRHLDSLLETVGGGGVPEGNP
jgi:pimeloyl-ACP methyl ester carboxylesterase